MTYLKRGLSVSAAVAVAFSTTASIAAEKTLTTVTALQITNVIAQSYLNTFVAPLNKRGKGVLQIKYLGGQEIVPPRKAAAALKRGQFDLLSCPTAYYIGTVPEGYALLASNHSRSARHCGWLRFHGRISDDDRFARGYKISCHPEFLSD